MKGCFRCQNYELSEILPLTVELNAMRNSLNVMLEGIGTMQNRFLNLDTFFICLAYGDLMVGISDGTICF